MASGRDTVGSLLHIQTAKRISLVSNGCAGLRTSLLIFLGFDIDFNVAGDCCIFTRLPPDVIEFVKRRLSGELDADEPYSSFEIIRSLPHGNVTAVLQTAKQLGLEGLLASRPCRERESILALVVARILSPRSKLSTTMALTAETAKHTLAEELATYTI